jgi:hypothetical protein
MTSFNKRVYEMLLRVLSFTENYRQRIGEGSPITPLLTLIEASAEKFAAQQSSNNSATEDGRVHTTSRGEARAALKDQLLAIGRTAKGLKFQQFWIVRDPSDLSLMTTADSFIQRAEPLRQAFIDSHLPSDFLDQLKSASRRLRDAINGQISTKGTRIQSRSAVDEARNQALTALENLDPLMENLLSDDLPALTAWRSARHVERYAIRKRAETSSPEPAPPNQITKTEAVAS